MKIYLELEEIDQTEKAATNLRDRLFVRLLFHLGCRISVALNIGIEDIDFGEGTITIQHLKTESRILMTVSRILTGKR